MAHSSRDSFHDIPVIEAALEKIIQKYRKRAVLLALLGPVLDRAISQIMEHHGVFLAWVGINLG